MPGLVFAPQVFALRAMLAVPYFEKALYELKDENVTPSAIAALADRVERDIQVRVPKAVVTQPSKQSQINI